MRLELQLVLSRFPLAHILLSRSPFIICQHSSFHSVHIRTGWLQVKSNTQKWHRLCSRQKRYVSGEVIDRSLTKCRMSATLFTSPDSLFHMYHTRPEDPRSPSSQSLSLHLPEVYECLSHLTEARRDCAPPLRSHTWWATCWVLDSHLWDATGTWALPEPLGFGLQGFWVRGQGSAKPPKR